MDQNTANSRVLVDKSGQFEDPDGNIPVSTLYGPSQVQTQHGPLQVPTQHGPLQVPKQQGSAQTSRTNPLAEILSHGAPP